MTASVPDHLKPVLAEVEAFVEQARGLKFKRPPKVALVPDEQFESLLLDDAEAEADDAGSQASGDTESQESFLGVMRALGLFDGSVDAAFRNPPTTTEQVLHPRRFLDGEGPVVVAPPSAGGAMVGEGSLGELGLILVTGSAVSDEDALDASAGWGGDWFRAWSEGSRTCVRWHIRMDTPTDVAELVQVMQAWAEKNPGAIVTGTDLLEVTNCA